MAHNRKYLNRRNFSARGQQEIFLNGQIVRAITGCEAVPVGLAMCSRFSNRRMSRQVPEGLLLFGMSGGTFSSTVMSHARIRFAADESLIRDLLRGIWNCSYRDGPERCDRSSDSRAFHR